LDRQKSGLLFMQGQHSFAMTVLPYTISDLENATHLNELNQQNYTTFCLDAFERGVGNGVDAVQREVDGFLIKKCAVDPQIYAFRYSFRPYGPQMGSIQQLSHSELPVVPEPVVRRNAQAVVYMSALHSTDEIYYTLDGSEPTERSALYTKPLYQPGNCTIKAFVRRQNQGRSRVNASHFEQMKVEPVRIDPGDIYFYKSVEVALSSETEDAAIYYTLDGKEVNMHATLYTGPILIEKNAELKVQAFKKGYLASDPGTAGYKQFAAENGVSYRYFPGKDPSIPHSFKLMPEKSGHISQISFKDIETNKTSYALQFLALLNIEEEGEYTFYTGSNDGSLLYIDNRLVVNNGGGHGYQEESGKIFLNKGAHFIEVGYFQAGGGQDLIVFYEGPGIAKKEIPAGAFK
jgi:hypothetical protein